MFKYNHIANPMSIRRRNHQGKSIHWTLYPDRANNCLVLKLSDHRHY